MAGTTRRSSGSGGEGDRGIPVDSLCRYSRVVPLERTCYSTGDDRFARYRADARKFCESIRDAHAQAERDGRFQKSVFRDAARKGFYCMNVPKEYGGYGLMDPRYGAIVNEETVRAGVDGFLAILGTDMVLPYLLNYGSGAQKAEWLPRVARGDVILGVAMSEPHTGSDVSNVHTRAVLAADGYHLHGTKFWISNGSIADLIIVVARTGGRDTPRHKALSLFLVPTATRGFRCSRVLHKLALHARDVCEIQLDDVVVPPTALLGEAGGAFTCLMRNLARERMAVALSAVASCEVALDQTLEYVKRRTMFGRRLGDLQYPAIKIAELKTETTVARVFVDKCLTQLCANALSGEVAAMAKWWCTAVQQRVVDSCLQFHGGFGFLLESPVDLGPSPIGKQWVAGRIQTIYAGSNETMKELIAKASGFKPRSKL